MLLLLLYLKTVPPHTSELLTSSFPSLLLSDSHVSFQQLWDAQYLYQYPNLIQLSKTHVNFPSVVAYHKRSSFVIGYQHNGIGEGSSFIYITSPHRVTFKCLLLNGVLVWFDIVTKLCTIAILCSILLLLFNNIFFFCLDVQQKYGGREMLKYIVAGFDVYKKKNKELL